jgi:hypothetical protein
MPRIRMTANDHDVNGKPLRYLGAMLGADVTPSFRQDLEAAIEADHPYEDASCDVREAAENGYTYVAAHLLMSATDELPNVGRVLWAHRFNRTLPDDFGTDLYDCADWSAHHAKYGRECDACGSYTYGEHESECGSCLAPLAETTDRDQPERAS